MLQNYIKMETRYVCVMYIVHVMLCHKLINIIINSNDVLCRAVVISLTLTLPMNDI